MNLSNEDVQDILRLLDTLPYGEFVLETSQFTLRLRRAEGGVWAQELTVLAEPVLAEPVLAEPVLAEPVLAEPVLAEPVLAEPVLAEPAGTPSAPAAEPRSAVPGSAVPGSAVPGSAVPGSAVPGSEGDPAPAAGQPGIRDAHEVRAQLPGTFYRAPNPGAPPFVEVGDEVTADSVVAIIETMKLMNPVYPGLAGTVAEICLADGEFAPQDAVLMRVSARAG